MKKIKKQKQYNVFYTIPQVEYEVVVKAKSMESAIKKVKNSIFKATIESVRGGWEIR